MKSDSVGKIKPKPTTKPSFHLLIYYSLTHTIYLCLYEFYSFISFVRMRSGDGDRGEGVRQNDEVMNKVNSLSDLEDKTFAECFSVIKREWFAPLTEHGCQFDLIFPAQILFFLIRYTLYTCIFTMI